MGKKKNSFPTLDLHGYKGDDVMDAVDAFIVRETRKNTSRARIMPGKGKGVVQKIVVDYLKTAGYSWEYEKMDNGKRNTGVLVVFLD